MAHYKTLYCIHGGDEEKTKLESDTSHSDNELSAHVWWDGAENELVSITAKIHTT